MLLTFNSDKSPSKAIDCTETTAISPVGGATVAALKQGEGRLRKILIFLKNFLVFPNVKDDYTTKNCTMGNNVKIKTSFSGVNRESLMTDSRTGLYS